MKQYTPSKLVKLTKTYFEDEISAGYSEFVVDKAKIKLSKKGKLLSDYKSKICSCTNCSLGKSRLNFVFGVGDADAKLMFIGEGPGFEEDHQGEPFIGRAGKLLNKIIESIGLTRQSVYIANIVKCHPMKDPTNPELHDNDRPPTKDEIEMCLPYLEKQIEIIAPKVICTLGNSALKPFVKTDLGISLVRGKFYDYKGIKLMPTFHPAALLRNPNLKKEVWDDMRAIRAEL